MKKDTCRAHAHGTFPDDQDLTLAVDRECLKRLRRTGVVPHPMSATDGRIDVKDLLSQMEALAPQPPLF